MQSSPILPPFLLLKQNKPHDPLRFPFFYTFLLSFSSSNYNRHNFFKKTGGEKEGKSGRIRARARKTFSNGRRRGDGGGVTTARRRWEEWDGVDLSRQTLAPRGVVPSSPPVSHYPTFCPIEIAREPRPHPSPRPLGATPSRPSTSTWRSWKLSLESCAFIAATIHSSIDATPSPQIPFRPDTRTLPPPSHGIPPLRPRAAKTRFAPEARASLISRSFSLPGGRRGRRND